MKLLVVIPAYNEEESLEIVVENFKQKCGWCDFIIVNDGSIDGTAALCMRKGYPLLNLPVNLGLSGAFGAGMKYAYKNGYDAVLQFDADGQHLPEYVLPLFNKLIDEECDVVIGSRFVNKKKPKSMRMLGSNLISLAIRLTTGTKIKDPTSGMRIWGKSLIEEFAKEINMTPEPDTLSYLIKRGALISEIQVEMRERIAGVSYLSAFKSIIYMLRMLISILLVQAFRGGKKILHVDQYYEEEKKAG